MSITTSLNKITDSIPEHCTLVAVSKTKPIESIHSCYEAGQRDFGENKVQELVDKAESLPPDIQWHMIGHLQRNKVKYIAPFVNLIHGVDSSRLLTEIEKRAKNEDRIINCLLQIHIAEEDSKFGFDEQEVLNLIEQNSFQELAHARITGLMGMATFTEDEAQVRKEFRSLKKLYDKLSSSIPNPHQMEVLSMGMSGDYQIAIEEGSTMVRIGSAIFGSRP
ncbi:MAG: YggS family pyridoxal phosphate-dependent enzyme [Bacteroidota bacterium]